MIVKFEEMWKEVLSVIVVDLEKGIGVDDDLYFVFLKYDDLYYYQNVFGFFVKMELDYDKKFKEVQFEDYFVVCWDMGLNNKYLVSFILFKIEFGDVKLVVGDEMCIKYKGEFCVLWEGVGYVIKIFNNQLDEVIFELRKVVNDKLVFIECMYNFLVDYVWKVMFYDCM